MKRRERTYIICFLKGWCLFHRRLYKLDSHLMSQLQQSPNQTILLKEKERRKKEK